MCRGVRYGLYFLITITLSGWSHPKVRAQELTTQAPAPESAREPLPEAPAYPVATVIRDAPEGKGGASGDAVIESDTQSMAGNTFIVDGGVVLTYEDRRVEADHAEYDRETGELTASGHVKVTGGPNAEVIQASHGELNLRTQTGRFFDVTGSVGVKKSARGTSYVSSNPFLFTGRMVVKTGPETYEVHDGTVTSCQLPHPDWMLSAGLFTMDGDKARAKNSIFKLLNVPLLYLPYVTHPTDADARQSGIMLPILEVGSSVKGTVVGDEFYAVLNRSMDLTVGLEYFSLRGWYEMGAFRYRGAGDDFVTVRYNGLVDRGITPPGGTYTNQGGEDLTAEARHDFSPENRAVADAEYLSSYVYREAFDENFNTAVSTDIKSTLYGVHQAGGYEAALEADRYQGLKQVQTAVTPQSQVRIFHVPALILDTTDHAIGSTGLRWDLDASAMGLKRVQPNFATGGIAERLDLHPEISYPISGGGWHLLPSVGVRDTLYSRSRQTPYGPGAPPVELTSGLNRADLEVGLEAKAPVIERTFRSALLDKIFGSEVKHTVEPEVAYRYVTGVNNFLNVLRFDDRDVVSDTNELEYGVTQRLFLRPGKSQPCTALESDIDPEPDQDELGAAAPRKKPETCRMRERISWRLAQKYFFDQTFGGAVQAGCRNIFDTTLSLSGVAFLTEPRAISPLISRMRLEPSAKVDLEWDFRPGHGSEEVHLEQRAGGPARGQCVCGFELCAAECAGSFLHGRDLVGDLELQPDAGAAGVWQGRPSRG